MKIESKVDVIRTVSDWKTVCETLGSPEDIFRSMLEIFTTKRPRKIKATIERLAEWVSDQGYSKNRSFKFKEMLYGLRDYGIKARIGVEGNMIPEDSALTWEQCIVYLDLENWYLRKRIRDCKSANPFRHISVAWGGYLAALRRKIREGRQEKKKNEIPPDMDRR